MYTHNIIKIQTTKILTIEIESYAIITDFES